ncbi:hypothetical protein JIN84_20075 [Luteolibacter yonseiensis]|uniref:Uncharacterized protein n=1 Tax=Luteolibacter yonseiensis TaxID=1144680 RepID=A0A934RA27_9BACT|nr:hypothetical protein [Luteolibacter yonseiensis]MBK1817930.1 hypothetical protein [Luteolibacter yonseiensis]
MKKWKNIAVILLLAGIVGGGVLAYNIHQLVTKTIPDSYAQWASAEMVIAFRNERNRMPGNWEELGPYYGPLHHGGLSFNEIRNRIIMDFPRLRELESDYSKRPLPEVIRTRSGTQAHWALAEPNQLVNQEVKK